METRRDETRKLQFERLLNRILGFYVKAYDRFDFLISGHQSVNPSSEAISILSDKYKRFMFVHPVPVRSKMEITLELILCLSNFSRWIEREQEGYQGTNITLIFTYPVDLFLIPYFLSILANFRNEADCLRSLQPLFTKLATSHISIQFFCKSVCIRVLHIFWDRVSFISLCFREKGSKLWKFMNDFHEVLLNKCLYFLCLLKNCWKNIAV